MRPSDLARTGDIWLFRGQTPADRAIQLATNSPVNHVGMAVVLGDLPPLMWHAELGRSLPDVWSGRRQRGVQLHVLSDAVTTWVNRYGQRAWVRQLSPEVTPAMEDAVLQVIARLDGTPFPSTVGLASRWLTGRLPSLRRPLGRPDGDGGAAARPAWRPRTARRCWPLPTRRWACCRAGGGRAGTTRGGSGAVTTCGWTAGTRWAASSRCGCRPAR